MSKLFIRSQDRKRIEEVKQVCLHRTYSNNPNNNNGYEEPKIVNCKVFINEKDFGVYKTEERAIEVLDEICVALSGKVIAQQKTSSKAKEKVGTVGENDSVELKTLNCDAVYQMPQE